MLRTAIYREGEARTEVEWSWWTVTCMAVVRAVEDGVVDKETFDELSSLETSLSQLRHVLQNHPQNEKLIELLDKAGNAQLRVTHAFMENVWEHFSNVKWSLGYTVKSSYSFTNPDTEEVLEIQEGDTLWTNV